MNVRVQFIEWIKNKEIYKGFNLETIIDRTLKFIEFDPFELKNDLNDIEKIKLKVSESIKYLKNNPEFNSFNNKTGEGIPSALLGNENYMQFLDQLKINLLTPYFNLSGIWTYQNVSGKTYNSSTQEANWYYETREKLYYLVNLLGELLEEEFIVVYTEQPNAQKGRGKILFKDYILAGFAPKKGNIKDNLFLKISFSGLKTNPSFAVDLDLNFRKGTSKFNSQRDEIYNKSLVEWKINDSFPNNWNDLLILIRPEILKLLVEFKKMTLLKSEKEVKVMNNISLNNILYGPPGTGKTYNTINKALEIINDKEVQELDFSDRKAVKDLFDKKVLEKQISFTTFHQSMAYEDFIEGIKPVLVDKDKDDEKLENGSVEYEIKDGIFKEIVNRAKGLSGKLNIDSSIDFRDKDYYKMSLGGKHRPEKHNWSIDNNLIFLGWGGDKDFSSLMSIKNWKEFKKTFIEKFPELVEESKYVIQAVYIFQKMKIGDVVIISKGNHIIDAIGVIESEYFYDDTKDIENYQFREVKWLATNLNASPELFVDKAISQQTIYQFYNQDINYESFEGFFKDKKSAESIKNYVLIIDEINRGNVSQIFGELITLIEEDKRIGKEEALEVILPYSKKKFGVPPNLYIIGTMNTADRSVEALDTALRRRFSFEEMMPKSDLITPSAMYCRLLWKYKEVGWASKEYQEKENELFDLLGVSDELKQKRKEIWGIMKSENQSDKLTYFDHFTFNGVDLRKILDIINKRIEYLIGRDHIIGHSYFISVNSLNDLKTVFQDKIIPLLQEYFFGDYGKIGLVLGKGFVRIKEFEKETSVFADFDIDSANDFEGRIVYEIVDYRETKDYILDFDKVQHKMTFEKAIKVLMNNKIE